MPHFIFLIVNFIISICYFKYILFYFIINTFSLLSITASMFISYIYSIHSVIVLSYQHKNYSITILILIFILCIDAAIFYLMNLGEYLAHMAIMILYPSITLSLLWILINLSSNYVIVTMIFVLMSINLFFSFINN